MRKTLLFAFVTILLYGGNLLGPSVARLGKCEMNKAAVRSYKKIAEPKFRPINPPVDVMVNPLIKPAREGGLCALE